MTRGTERRSAAGFGAGLAAVSLLAILVVTLRPAAALHSLGGPGLCLICGRFGLANVLRNVLLFVPLGVGLGLAFRDPVRAWLPAPLLSAGIETAQLFIAGRNSLPIDVAANAAGGGIGVVLALALVAAAASSPWARAAGATTLLVSTGTLAATAWAFQLVPPPPPHHVQWTPRLSHFEPYRGRLLEATLEGGALPRGRHADPARLEARLLGGAALQLELEAGPPPGRLAPIFAIHTAAREEVFVLGARRDDLVLRLPFRAALLRLDRPELALDGGLAGIEPGARLAVSFELTDDGACLRAAAAARCGLRPTMGQGWALLLYPAGASDGLQRALTAGWLAGLAFLPAVLLGSVGAAAGTALILGAAALAFPTLAGSVAHTPALELLFVVAGAAAGAGLMRLLRPRRPNRRESAQRGHGRCEPATARPARSGRWATAPDRPSGREAGFSGMQPANSGRPPTTRHEAERRRDPRET